MHGRPMKLQDEKMALGMDKRQMLKLRSAEFEQVAFYMGRNGIYRPVAGPERSHGEHGPLSLCSLLVDIFTFTSWSVWGFQFNQHGQKFNHISHWSVLGQDRGALGSTVASQQEGPWFEPHPRHSVWSLYLLPMSAWIVQRYAYLHHSFITITQHLQKYYVQVLRFPWGYFGRTILSRPIFEQTRIIFRVKSY